MGVRLSSIKGEQRTIIVPFGEAGDLHVTYRPGGITPAREEELEVDVANGRGARAMVALLCEVLVEWDLLDDDGVPLPFDVDLLMHAVHGDVFAAVFEAMKAATSPGEASAGT